MWSFSDHLPLASLRTKIRFLTFLVFALLWKNQELWASYLSQEDLDLLSQYDSSSESWSSSWEKKLVFSAKTLLERGWVKMNSSFVLMHSIDSHLEQKVSQCHFRIATVKNFLFSHTWNIETPVTKVSHAWQTMPSQSSCEVHICSKRNYFQTLIEGKKPFLSSKKMGTWSDLQGFKCCIETKEKGKRLIQQRVVKTQSRCSLIPP